MAAFWSDVARVVKGKPFARSLFKPDLLIHFTYHKCLTVYYQRVMSALSAEFGFANTNFNDDIAAFHQDAAHGSGKRVLGLNARNQVEWARFQEFRGSHFIRDPRDLVVSGYHYHLWTPGDWCRAADFDWRPYTSAPEFAWVEPDASQHPRRVSYQSYLNRLGPERGLLMEMVFQNVNGTFPSLRDWNYGRPQVLELRYEDIVGNEEAAFARLFAHYGLHPRLAERGLEIVSQLKLQNQRKHERAHTRSGELGQWRGEFTPRIKELFKRCHGELVVRLGYERDDRW